MFQRIWEYPENLLYLVLRRNTMQKEMQQEVTYTLLYTDNYSLYNNTYYYPDGNPQSTDPFGIT
jgi:hypothetical protein